MSKAIKEIRFPTNFNNKLYCTIIATIRFSVGPWCEGDQVNILLRKSGAYISTGFGIIENIYKDIPINQLYWFIPLDTGYSLQDSLKMFTGFNGNIPITDETLVNVIIIKRLTPVIKEIK